LTKQRKRMARMLWKRKQRNVRRMMCGTMLLRKRSRRT
jgi:hypothetical protein